MREAERFSDLMEAGANTSNDANKQLKNGHSNKEPFRQFEDTALLLSFVSPNRASEEQVNKKWRARKPERGNTVELPYSFGVWFLHQHTQQDQRPKECFAKHNPKQKRNNNR
jgi:hypothetical protein